MKFSTNEDVDAPVDVVFEALCDFDRAERAAIRRGAEVRRIDTLKAPAVGMTWDARFNFRGREREVQVELTRLERPHVLIFDSVSPSMTGQMHLDLTAIAKGRTRMKVGIEIKPLNLSARLLVQSLRLAKYSLTKRYKQRVAQYARMLEEQHRGMV
jgi:carbon monoxide dehydrogenase subunit G